MSTPQNLRHPFAAVRKRAPLLGVRALPRTGNRYNVEITAVMVLTALAHLADA